MAIVKIPATTPRIVTPERDGVPGHARHRVRAVDARASRRRPMRRRSTARRLRAREIDALKARGGYVTADVIDVKPDTPNLDMMLAKFSREHWHDEDEVRFIIEGRGLFHVHPEQGDVFAIEVEAGDLIRVPRGTHHWFDLCADRRIRAIRLFQDTLGLDAALHRQRRRQRLSADLLRSVVRARRRAAARVSDARRSAPRRRGAAGHRRDDDADRVRLPDPVPVRAREPDPISRRRGIAARDRSRWSIGSSTNGRWIPTLPEWIRCRIRSMADGSRPQVDAAERAARADLGRGLRAWGAHR